MSVIYKCDYCDSEHEEDDLFALRDIKEDLIHSHLCSDCVSRIEYPSDKRFKVWKAEVHDRFDKVETLIKTIQLWMIEQSTAEKTSE